jgi:hypothetical protein
MEGKNMKYYTAIYTVNGIVYGILEDPKCKIQIPKDSLHRPWNFGLGTWDLEFLIGIN